MEQALINEGIPVEEISRLCDVHAAVFRDAPVSDSPERIFTYPVSYTHLDVYKRQAVMSAEIRGASLTGL